MRDYYKTLGLPFNATPSAIKAAYHDLAREHHPDVAGRRAHSDQLIRDINQAYSVLSDPKMRRAYDAGRRHTAKDHDNQTHRFKTVGAVATAITVCFGLALVYAFDRDWGFAEQLQPASSRSDDDSRTTQNSGWTEKSDQLPERAQQPEQQVAEWKFATKDVTQTASPRSTVTMNENEVGNPNSPTHTSEPKLGSLSDKSSQSRRSKSETSQVRVEDKTDRPASQDISLWESKVHDAIGKPPAHHREKSVSAAPDAVSRGAALRSTKPVASQRKQPRIGQSWSQSWTLIAKRWSPRFHVRHFRIDLEKDCASCKWIKFAALRHDVRIHEARIHYSDGTSRKLNVPGAIEDGHATAPQKLGVRFAKFSYISITHQSRFNFESGGWLAVYGIEDLGTGEEHQMVSRSH